jgi:hypothetical protein
MNLSNGRLQRTGLVLLVRRHFHRLKRWGLRYIERGTFLRPYGHDMTMLLQADDRVLKDIGLTRGDMRAVAHCDVMARAAASRRRDAIASAGRRKIVQRHAT